MRTLIIPDIHTHYKKAQQIIDSEKFDKIIFGGDLFDQFDDTPVDNIDTAIWFKNLYNKYKIEIVLSNHDAAYRWPTNQELTCSGFSWPKALGINNIFTKEDWSKFKLYTEEQSFIITHAGVSKRLFEHIIVSRDEKKLKEKKSLLLEMLNTESPIAIDLAEANQGHVFFAASYYRGGYSLIPGLNWCDYREFVPIKNVNQIFFHTPMRNPMCKTMNHNGHIANWLVDDRLQQCDIDYCSYNYDLDTHLKFYGILEDKKLEIHQAFNQDGNFDKKLIYSKQH